MADAAQVYLAADLGASSGRVVAGVFDGEKLSLEEVYRFDNGGIAAAGRMQWDLLHQWSHVQRGLRAASKLYPGQIKSVGVDTWGVDFGLVGRNVLEEKRLELAARGHTPSFTELRTLDYGRCRLSLAVPEGFTYEGPRSLAGKRIATTYPFTLERYLRERNVTADIVTLLGAVEIAPRLGRADLICDLVSTGSTLQANHLTEVETVLQSQALLIRTPVELPEAKQEWVDRLLLRIDGVQQVRESKYIMLHAPRSALPEIRRLLPGSESPTIIPLEGSNDKVAIHAVCRENVFWETLESLKKAGASALLVLPVEKMLV